MFQIVVSVGPPTLWTQRAGFSPFSCFTRLTGKKSPPMTTVRRLVSALVRLHSSAASISINAGTEFQKVT